MLDDIFDTGAPVQAGSAPGAPAAPVSVVLRRLVVWGPDGTPVLTTEPVITKAQINDLYMAAAAQPYVPDPHNPQDAQYAGLTCAEVIVRKQIILAARTGEAETVMDRLVGRPKQSVESTKLTLTYEDTLKEIARKAGIPHGRPAGPPPIDAEAL